VAEAEVAGGGAERLLVALVAEVVGAVIARRPPSVPGLEAVAAQADAQGLPWVARVARGLQVVGLLLTAPTEDRAATCADLLQEGERRGDPWSQLLLSTAVGAALALVGETDAATGTLRRAEVLAGSLHAPVLQAWATALRLAARPVGSVPTPGDAAELSRWAGRLGVAPAPLLAAGALRSWGAALAASARTGPEPVGPAAPVGPVAVRLRTLGAFALEVNGLEVGWSELRPRARMLLMMMVAQHGRPVHRERLVDALWPGTGLGAGVRSLQVAVSSVRQCLVRAGLGEAVLQRQGDAYALRLDGVDDQCAAFERLVGEAERLQRDGDRGGALRCRLAAVQRYAGDLLPEMGPAEWVLEERARLRSLAARTAFAAAELAGELGDLDAGRAAAARSVELDPYRDTGWALLADLHERQGDLSAAAVARREHRRVRAELGLPDRTGPPSAARARRPEVIRPPRPASDGVRARA
jgi:DNA-binding SARP family transcriptional activator